MNASTGSKGARGGLGLEIKGSGAAIDSSRRSSLASTPVTGPASADPHAAERSARDRERLLKETRRMAMAGLAGAKRSRGGDELGDDSRKSSRRKGRRGEVVMEDEEERMRRLEAERERERDY